MYVSSRSQFRYSVKPSVDRALIPTPSWKPAPALSAVGSRGWARAEESMRLNVCHRVWV